VWTKRSSFSLCAAVGLALTALAVASAEPRCAFPYCPNPAYTTGLVGTTSATTVCNRSTKTVRNVSAAEKRQIYASYHIDPAAPAVKETRMPSTVADSDEGVDSSPKLDPNAPGKPGPGGSQYEIDHLIPLELGGSNDAKNLWPQSYRQAWGAHIKDELENKLHKMVCAHQITLPEAQAAIRKNWVSAYDTYYAPSRLKKTTP
jgi:hypothetical protein